MTVIRGTMNKSLAIVWRSTLLQHNCQRKFPQIRRYVNWRPDKPQNKKGKGQPVSLPRQPSPQRPPPPTGDAQSPAELDKAFQAPPPPPPPEEPEFASADAEPEPQLLRLKNNKTFNQWEKEWSERVWRAGQLTLIAGIFLAAYAIGAGYVQFPYGMNYRASKLPPEGSEEEALYLAKVEATLHSLPLVQKLSQDKEWIKTIGIFPIPKEDITHNLTVGSLAGMGKISVKPVTFYNDKTKEFVVVMHVGQDICGHRGLVHGGFLATILDECLGKTVILPPKDWFNAKAITTLSKEFDANGKRRQVWPEDRIIVTANLNINYRAPTKVNQFLVVKAILTDVIPYLYLKLTLANGTQGKSKRTDRDD